MLTSNMNPLSRNAGRKVTRIAVCPATNWLRVTAEINRPIPRTTNRNSELTKIAQIQLVSAKADPQVVSGYKNAFGEWIIACGLRELTETFAIFLDGVHRSCLIMATHGNVPFVSIGYR